MKLERELREMKSTPQINQCVCTLVCIVLNQRGRYPGLQSREDGKSFAEAQQDWAAERDRQIEQATRQKLAAEVNGSNYRVLERVVQVQEVGKMELPSKKQSEKLLENRSRCCNLGMASEGSVRRRGYTGPVTGWAQQQTKSKQKHSIGATLDAAEMPRADW